MNKKSVKIQDEINQLEKEDFSVLDKEHGFMVAGILGGFSAAIHKMEYLFIKQILLGVLGGIILAAGYTAVVFATVTKPGMDPIFLGILFPGCIITITFLGGGLYTSHVVSTIPTIKKTIFVEDYLKGILGVLLGNFLGTLFFVIIFTLAGAHTNSAVFAKAYSMGIHKMFEAGESNSAKTIVISVIAVFASGILCNIMVSSTLPLTSASKNTLAPFFLFLFPIAFFVISGYQHAPANTFFLWMMISENIFHFGSDALQNTYHINEQWVDIVKYIFINLIPAILGNWVGGAIILPGILHLINSDITNVFFKKERLKFLNHQLGRIQEKEEAKKLKLEQKAKNKSVKKL
ncbi:formate/nitrite transporter [Spiroplasma chinense]|uniref:Formate/nitrite transporter n=1 Tax=Spiroplasma chinense TaxID=216932 RepID=A0A5B9Y3D4_9MOLU|nr:formate/nitrite transporter family protein [Spiroplasma chinense]QEH61544.1 formate/nitrite transporter [Spiroplasma chinense]